MRSWKVEKNGNPRANPWRVRAINSVSCGARFAVLEQQPEIGTAITTKPNAAGTHHRRVPDTPGQQGDRTPAG